MPTIADVAKKAGVSPATVSRALKNSASVNEEKKNRIFSAAEELNYKIERVQRSGDRQRIVLITAMVDPDLINGIEAVIQEQGYSLVVITVGITVQTMEEAYSKLIGLEPFVSGVMIYGLFCDERIIKKIKRNYSVIVLGSNEACGTYIVGIDDVAASMDMMNHIIQKGHKRIALLTGDKGNPRVRLFSSEREVGYMKALLENGLEYDPGIVMAGMITEESGYALTGRLLDENHGIDAIYCVSDAMAVGCLRALHEKGVAVPEEIAVCGFDNTVKSKWSIPRLTTIEPNLREIGARAAELILILLQGGEYENCKVYVKHQLVCRESL